MEIDRNNFSTEDIMRLAQTPAGQQLIAILRKSDGPALRNAAAQASSGNYQQAKSALEPLLRSPEIQNLLKQLGEK